MRNQRVRWAILAASCGVLACGQEAAPLATDAGTADLFVDDPDDGVAGDGGVTIPHTPERLPELLADTLCEAKFGCDQLSLFADREQCVANLELWRTLDYLDAVSNNWMSVDVEAALSCTARLFNDRCLDGAFQLTSGIYDLLDGCVGATLGQQAVNEPCTDAAHCAPGGYCDLVNNACPGVCVAHSPLGVACNRAAQCGPAATCSSTCVRRATEGESCPEGACAAGLACRGEPAMCIPLASEGEPCAGVPCESGLICDTAFGGVGLCVPYGVVGAMCTFGANCGLDLGCAQAAVGELGTCEHGAALGEACDATRFCSFGLDCNASSGVCTGAGVGEFCGALPRAMCGEGLVCHIRNCRVPAGLGDACEDAQTIGCIGGRCVNGVCEAAGVEGDPCQWFADCLPHLGCVENVCARRPNNCR